MTEKQFTEGLFVNPPKNNAPDFVIGSIGVKKEEFINWINKQEGETINIKLLRARKDPSKGYGELDTWKPQPKGEQAPQAQKSTIDVSDDLPF